MHLGVVNVGLLGLAKPEVISLHLISAKKNSMLDRTLTTPIKSKLTIYMQSCKRKLNSLSLTVNKVCNI